MNKKKITKTININQIYNKKEVKLSSQTKKITNSHREKWEFIKNLFLFLEFYKYFSLEKIVIYKKN